MQSYLDSLDENFQSAGLQKPPTKIVRSAVPPINKSDGGCINPGSKRGIGYLMEATVDCKRTAF